MPQDTAASHFKKWYYWYKSSDSVGATWDPALHMGRMVHLEHGAGYGMEDCAVFS